MQLQYSLLLTVLVFSFSLKAQQDNCFHPERDKDVVALLKPNHVRQNPNNYVLHESFGEDQFVIKQIHDKILSAYKKHGIDPRLTYARMMGESKGNPLVTQMKKGVAYGIVQFNNEKDKDNLVGWCGKSKTPRLCQIEYYVDVYIKRFSIAQMPENCGVKWLKDASQFNKFIYLNYGSCSTEFVNAQKKACTSSGKNKTYHWMGGCRLIGQVFNAKVPLCDDYVNPQNYQGSGSRPAPSTETAPSKPRRIKPIETGGGPGATF